MKDYHQKEQTTATTADEDDDIDSETITTTRSKEDINTEKQEGDRMTAATEFDPDMGDGEPHTSMRPCKKQKVNICMVTPTTIKRETAPESDVAKVNTTFTNTLTNTNITTTSTTNIAPVSTITDASLRGGDAAAPPASVPCSDSWHYCSISGDGSGDDISAGQRNKPEMPSLPKNCVLQKILHLQLLAKVSKALRVFFVRSTETHLKLRSALQALERRSVQSKKIRVLTISCEKKVARNEGN